MASTDTHAWLLVNFWLTIKKNMLYLIYIHMDLYDYFIVYYFFTFN